ncbi:hypothetical protein L1987_87337 [Smallanthus sonchifolius]|nr:hypothetical protein L1987_87337 [Smallanthus sonchifolius]
MLIKHHQSVKSLQLSHLVVSSVHNWNAKSSSTTQPVELENPPQPVKLLTKNLYEGESTWDSVSKLRVFFLWSATPWVEEKPSCGGSRNKGILIFWVCGTGETEKR